MHTMEHDLTMSAAELAAASAQFEAEQEADRKAIEQIEALAVTWRQTWPHHCQACKGWGGSTHYQSHPYGNTSASEAIFDVCEATAKAETCHRCAQDGLSEEGEGPCMHCGWNFDDGVPQY